MNNLIDNMGFHPRFCDRGVYPAITTLVLIAVALVAGGLTWIVVKGQSSSLSRNVNLEARSVDLISTTGGDQFSLTLKNSGTVLIDEVVVSLLGVGETGTYSSSDFSGGTHENTVSGSLKLANDYPKLRVFDNPPPNDGGDTRTPISNVQELQNIQDNLSGDYYLTENIDAADTKNWNGGKGFNPIGDYDHPFSGTFDGNGHIIENLYINRGSTNYVGLFGYIDSGAVIENVGLRNVNIHGEEDVGGLVGFSDSARVSNSRVTGEVHGSECVGGLVGFNNVSSLVGQYAKVNVKLETDNTTHSPSLADYTINTSINTSMVGKTYESWMNNTAENNATTMITYPGEKLELAGKNAVLWVTFDELPAGFDGKDDPVYDLTGYVNDGTAVGGPVEDTGKWDNCLRFDGSDDHVEIPDDGSLHLTDMTLMAWVDISRTSAWQTIVGKGLRGDPRNYRFGIGGSGKATNKGVLEIEDTSGNGHSVISTTDWADAGLIHVAATYDGSDFKLYLNGEADGSKAEAFTPEDSNTHSLGIGAVYDAGSGWTNYAKGRIDEVRIYNRVLTAKEIKQIYNRTKPDKLIGDDSLSGVWEAKWWDIGEKASIDNVDYSAAIGVNENILINVEASDDGLTVRDSTGWKQLTDGSNTLTVNLVGHNHRVQVTNCYSASEVHGSSNVGGLIGCSDESSVSNSFWDIETSGRSSSDGGTGKTTEKMKTKSTFTNAGWNFQDVWRMGSAPSGRWTSSWINLSNTVNYSSLRTATSIPSNAEVDVRVQSSIDGVNVGGETLWVSLNDGFNAVDLTDLDPGRYVRVLYKLTAGSTPVVEDYAIEYSSTPRLTVENLEPGRTSSVSSSLSPGAISSGETAIVSIKAYVDNETVFSKVIAVKVR